VVGLRRVFKVLRMPCSKWVSWALQRRLLTAKPGAGYNAAKMAVLDDGSPLAAAGYRLAAPRLALAGSERLRFICPAVMMAA
jgi:hypothetical protein